MTDPNHIEVLHQVTCIAREYRDGILDDTLMVREMTAALSARASAGEGGVWVDPEQLTAWFANPAMNRLHPQPQQTKKYSLALTPASPATFGGSDAQD